MDSSVLELLDDVLVWSSMTLLLDFVLYDVSSKWIRKHRFKDKHINLLFLTSSEHELPRVVRSSFNHHLPRVRVLLLPLHLVDE